MLTWNDLRETEVRDDLLNEDKYALVGKKLSHGDIHKIEALVIDIEFARTLSGDIQKIIKELIK